MEENMEKVVGDTTEKWLEWKCVFCKQDLKDSTPKLLPCFHSCCSSCMVTDEDGRESRSKCPVCNQTFLHSESIDNYFMRELANDNKAEEKQAASCTSCEDNAEATSFCTDCGEWLCDACVQAHQRVRVTKDHVIRGKDEGIVDQGGGGLGQRTMFCPVHKQEQLKLFCETCDLLTCRDCQLAGHRDHRYQFVSEACKQQKAHIQAIANCLKERKAQLEQARDVSSRVYKDLVDREQFIREGIKQFAMRFISEIGQRSRQLVKDLHNVCGHKKAELSVTNKEVICLIVKMEHSLKFVEDALEQGSDLALLYSKRILLKQLIALQRVQCSAPPPTSPVDIRFVYEHQNLVNYIRNLGILMVGDKPASGGNPSHTPPPNVSVGNTQGVGVAPQLKPQQMNGLSHLLSMPPPYKQAQGSADSRVGHNVPSPTNPLVTSSSQPSFRQQNTHLWNLLEKAPLGQPIAAGSPFVKPSGTFMPPSGVSSPRLLPRSSVSILPAGANSGAQVSVSTPSTIVPNIIILPMGQNVGQQQRPIPQYHHPQQHYHPPLPVSSPSSIPQGSNPTSNILLTSGTQRLSHFPQAQARATPPLAPPVIASAGSPNVGQPLMISTPRPQTPTTRSWVSSPHSTLAGTDGNNSRDSNLKNGSNLKVEKVSSSQRSSCSLMGITIKQEKPDETDDICIEMAANVLKEFSQDSMDGLFANLRSDTTKEAEAAGSSTRDDSSGAKTQQQKLVQADSSSSPNAILENSLDNVISIPSQSKSNSTTSMIKSPSRSKKEKSASLSEKEKDDGNISDASTEKAQSPRESELVDLTIGDTSESEGRASPMLPKILETRTLSGTQSEDPNEDWCAVCHDGGELLCCGKCPRVYHLQCHVPALPADSQEEDNWQCLMCKDLNEIPEASTEEEKRKFKDEITGKTQKICERILLELFCHETSPPFHEPVSKADVPEYYKIIHKPMSLDQIKSKLDPTSYNHYTNVTDFLQDLRLVFANCYTFNEKDSDVYGAAKKVEAYLEGLLLKYLPEHEYSVQGSNSSESKPRVKRRKQASAPDDIMQFVY